MFSSCFAKLRELLDPSGLDASRERAPGDHAERPSFVVHPCQIDFKFLDAAGTTLDHKKIAAK
jgi:hypothetical protein